MQVKKEVKFRQEDGGERCNLQKVTCDETEEYKIDNRKEQNDNYEVEENPINWEDEAENQNDNAETSEGAQNVDASLK